MTQPQADTLRFGTKAIHAGVTPEPTTGAIMTPIFQTSTYVQPAVGEPIGHYDYGRTANPTREALEANLAALESGSEAVAFSSGLAAIEAIVKRLSAGDHVVSEENTYGGTGRLFNQVLTRFGIEFTYVDSGDAEAVRDAMRPNTKLVHVETPTNPMMRICDIARVAEIARSTAGWSSRNLATASPLWLCCLIRTCRVLSPRSVSQQSRGPGTAPVDMRMKTSSSKRSSLATATMPPMTSEWPFTYLVEECTEKSAPSSNGRWL